jgi:hypothetical protein
VRVSQSSIFHASYRRRIKTSILCVSVHTGDIELMRTTLTLDDDVAVLLEKFTRESGLTFRDAVN